MYVGIEYFHDLVTDLVIYTAFILTTMAGQYIEPFRLRSMTYIYRRFADKVLREEERRPHLVAMIQAYLSTMNDLGTESWLMHGSLMGWWWNQKVKARTLSDLLWEANGSWANRSFLGILI